MKNFSLSTFLGCCVISLGIIVAGVLISSKIPPVNVPSSFTLKETAWEYDDYMSQYEAAAFLKIDADTFTGMMRSGQLLGTYTVVEGGSVFSREKLSQWIEDRIEG